MPGPTFKHSFPEHSLVESAHHRCVDDQAIPLVPHRAVAEENVKDCIVTAAMDRDAVLGASLHQHPNDLLTGGTHPLVGPILAACPRNTSLQRNSLYLHYGCPKWFK